MTPLSRKHVPCKLMGAGINRERFAILVGTGPSLCLEMPWDDRTRRALAIVACERLDAVTCREIEGVLDVVDDVRRLRWGRDP